MTDGEGWVFKRTSESKSRAFHRRWAISPFWWRKQLDRDEEGQGHTIYQHSSTLQTLSFSSLLSSLFLLFSLLFLPSFLYLIKIRFLISLLFYFLSSSLYFIMIYRQITCTLFPHVSNKSEPRPEHNRLLSNKQHLNTSSVTYFLWEKDTTKNKCPSFTTHCTGVHIQVSCFEQTANL